jgi:hypothetical protein
VPEIEIRTPRPSDGQRGALWLFQRIISSETPERCKATLALLAGGTLCFGFLALVAGVLWQAIGTDEGHVNAELVWAVIGVAAFLAIMATFSYLKAEAKVPMPGGEE